MNIRKILSILGSGLNLRLRIWGIRYVDAQGLHTTEKKVEAVLNACQPNNVTGLHSILDLLHYYSKFLPNLSSVEE